MIRILNEIVNFIGKICCKRIGKFRIKKGDLILQKPKGLEDRPCYVQEVRIYYTKKRVISLWRRSDNSKYFYAELNNPNDKDKGWKSLIISEVPIEIRNDFQDARI